MTTASDFASAWADYKRRRRWLFGVWLGGFFLIAALGRLLSASGLGGGAVFGLLAPLWLFSFLLVTVRMNTFPCPRCHRWFFATWWCRNPLSRKCLNCGLPKWSESDPDEKRVAEPR